MSTDDERNRDPISAFLEGARAVARAIADPAVAHAWDTLSVLEGQKVSGLAGHLARGGVWVVADYLDRAAPVGPVDFDSAGDYFASIMSAVSPEDHQAIRDRGAAVAAAGHEALVDQLHARLEALEPRLGTADADRLIAVIDGKVMRLADYLLTRIVEQAVHLDDLARSTGHEPWPYPRPGRGLAIEIGVNIARRRSGDAAVLRALYRDGFSPGAMPVL